MCSALDGDGLEAGIGKDNFFVTRRGGIAFEGRLDVGAKNIANGRNLVEKTEQNLSRAFVRSFRIAGRKALPYLRSEPFGKRLETISGGFGEFIFVDRTLVVESRKQNLQQLLAQRIDSAFRGKIVAIGVVQPANRLVGGENFFGNPVEAALHGGKTIAGEVDLSRIRLESGSGAFGRQRPIACAAEVAGGFVVRLGFVGFFNFKQYAFRGLHFH